MQINNRAFYQRLKTLAAPITFQSLMLAAVAAAGKLLYACPEHTAFLDALHAYNERLKQL